jgi:LEA14-like dessication related protein
MNLNGMKILKNKRLQSRHHIAIVMGLVFSMGGISGCAGLGKRVEPPRMNITRITVQEVREFEAVFKIDLRVFNTNEAPLPVRGIDFRLELNDRYIASGISSTLTEIPAYGTATVPIVVYSSLLDMAKGMLGLHREQKIRYRVAGHLRIDGGLLAPSTIPFESVGELSADKIIGSNQE